MSSSAEPRQTPQAPQRGDLQDHVDSSTSQSAPPQASSKKKKKKKKGIPPHTLLPENIPAQASQLAFKKLAMSIQPDNDDNQIREFLDLVWIAVHKALEQHPELRENLADEAGFLKNVKRRGEKEFFDSLRDMAKTGSWAALFEDDVFLNAPEESLNTANVFDTEHAWSLEYKGNASSVLLRSIADFLNNERQPYARQTNIMNSSGTGKSRMVDELARRIITVPMCLRPDKNQGFPPPDVTLRSWVYPGSIDRADAQKRLHGFMYGLLTVTHITLEAIESEMVGVMMETETEEGVIKRQEELAAAFREKMTEGQDFNRSNVYRKRFYDKVIEVAYKFIQGSRKVVPAEEPEGIYDSKELGDIQGAAKKLSEFVDPQYKLDRPKGPRRPLVIFAFDEAHTLTDNPPEKPWNLFSELRRILRQISMHPIFSLFLSTAGRFNLFSPVTRSDPSNRVRDASFPTLDPITEISFDDLALSSGPGAVTLGEVVEMKWMCHLGRPLYVHVGYQHPFASERLTSTSNRFGSHWDVKPAEQRNESAIMDFAKGKLLDGPAELDPTDRSGSLACLSVRFALEFNSAEEKTSGVLCTQVERHMRLCLAVTAGREKFITLAGSEPLLAEAAYEVVKRSQSNPVWHLDRHSDLNCVDRGRRGELVATLLIMQAFDAARAMSTGSRWVSVDAFMKELLPEVSYQALHGSLPTFALHDQNYNFVETFRGYGMWFNHVIKIEDNSMFTADHLWKFVTRGAMILCADGQEGIDIVLPVCDTQRTLSRDTVTAIVIQVKNDEKYKLKIGKTLFDRMSPVKLGLFPDGVNPKPVIRLVLALASKDAGVSFPGVREHEPHHPDSFTAFDVWIAGLSAAAHKHIEKDLSSYISLLDRSLRPHDAFNMTDDDRMEDEARRSRGDVRRKMAPLILKDVRHNYVYISKG